MRLHPGDALGVPRASLDRDHRRGTDVHRARGGPGRLALLEHAGPRLSDAKRDRQLRGQGDGPSITLGNRFFGCVIGNLGTGMLTFTMSDPAPGDPTFAADISATQIEVAKARGGTCRGFVATSSPTQAIALVGPNEFTVEQSGRVRLRGAMSTPVAPNLAYAEIQVPGWTVGRDADDRVLRGHSGGPLEVVVGGAQPVLHIGALAAAPDGFVALQTDGMPFLLDVTSDDVAACRPRAPHPIAIDGLTPVLTTTTAPLEAWAEHDGIWWAWQRRGVGHTVLVRIDLGASRADTFQVDAPPGFPATR